jgi:predicted tellurium resistance membrane protein TerC
MADDRRPRTSLFVWLILGVAVLFVLRFALHAVSRLVDLVSTVVVLGVLGFVGWKFVLGGRRSRHRD